MPLHLSGNAGKCSDFCSGTVGCKLSGKEAETVSREVGDHVIICRYQKEAGRLYIGDEV